MKIYMILDSYYASEGIDKIFLCEEKAQEYLYKMLSKYGDGWRMVVYDVDETEV